MDKGLVTALTHDAMNFISLISGVCLIGFGVNWYLAIGLMLIAFYIRK